MPKLVLPVKPGVRVTQEDVERYAEGIKAGMAAPKPDRAKPVAQTTPKPHAEIRNALGSTCRRALTTKPRAALALTANTEGLMA